MKVMLACIVSRALVLAAMAPAAADARLTVSSASALFAKAAEIEGSAAEAAHRRLQQAATTPPQLVPFQNILLPLLRTVGPGRPVSFKNFESAGCQAFAEIARLNTYCCNIFSRWQTIRLTVTETCLLLMQCTKASHKPTCCCSTVSLLRMAC